MEPTTTAAAAASASAVGAGGLASRPDGPSRAPLLGRERLDGSRVGRWGAGDRSADADLSVLSATGWRVTAGPYRRPGGRARRRAPPGRAEAGRVVHLADAAAGAPCWALLHTGIPAGA